MNQKQENSEPYNLDKIIIKDLKIQLSKEKYDLPFQSINEVATYLYELKYEQIKSTKPITPKYPLEKVISALAILPISSNSISKEIVFESAFKYASEYLSELFNCIKRYDYAGKDEEGDFITIESNPLRVINKKR